jgi:putative hydrolase
MTLDDAFDRIVYLLDRSLAPGPKVRAFQRARRIAAERGEDELRALIAAGRLTELEGIGASTGSVIIEALAGATPTYLADLEAGTEIPLGEGAELRDALRGDCHAHSTWSDGGAPIRRMAETARALGHDYLVMTDHSPRLTVAHGLSPERLREQLVEIDALNRELDPFRILTGMEVDILEDGTLDLDDALLGELDVVVASVHSKLRLPREEMTRRMVLAVANPHTDILGHCTNRKVTGRGRPPSDFDAEIVFAACREFDTAVEINCRPERQDPPDELLALAVDWDCPIAIDTDAHAPGQLEWQNYGCDKAARHGIEPAAVVNTRTADDLVAWAAGHDAA